MCMYRTAKEAEKVIEQQTEEKTEKKKKRARKKAKKADDLPGAKVNKVIVFSQWGQFLEMCKAALTSHGIPFMLVKGTPIAVETDTPVICSFIWWRSLAHV